MDPSTTTNDSLPYIEAVHEDYEEYGLALIEEEMQQTQPRVLRKLPDIRFRTAMMRAEYEARVVDGQYVKREDNSYHPLKIARPNSLDEWRSVAIPQAKAQFEAERLRGLLLDAEKDDAVAHWQTYNSQILAPLHAQVTATLASQREAVEDVNFQRQQLQQQQWAPELEQLNTDYQQMLYRRNQLEHANEGLRRESRQ